MRGIFERFDRLDTSLNHWLVRNSISLLRVSLGLVFLVFGALKFFSGLSPIEELATRTTTMLTFGLIPPDMGLVMIAALEVAIGLCLLRGGFCGWECGLWGLRCWGRCPPWCCSPVSYLPAPYTRQRSWRSTS